MDTLRSIVVATDFSQDARLAAMRAVALAAEFGVDDLRLVHVVEAPWLGMLQQWLGAGEDSRGGLVRDAERSMAQLVAAIEAEAGRRPGSEVVVGKLLDAVIEAAARCDLLVVGARGEHPVRDFAVGTTGERLLRKRRGPMLVVRGDPAQPYRRVLAALDFSPHAAPVLAQAAAIAPAAQIEALHAFEVPFESKLRFAGVADDEIHRLRQHARTQAVDGVSRLVGEAGVDAGCVRRRVEHGYPPRVIVDAAREAGADLIVIGKHGESVVEDLLLGSVTLHVLGEARCDVLVVSAGQSSNGSPT